MMSTRIGHYIWNASLLVCTFMALAGAAAMAQNPSGATRDPSVAGPAFEVATIRPANRDDGRRWFGMKLDASGRFQASAVSLSTLILEAYLDGPEGKVTTDRAVPKWVGSEEFDIQAKIDDAYTSGWDKLSYEKQMDVVRPMIRQLLAERFHVKLRLETRNTPVYALVQAKSGAHVKEVLAPDPIDGDPSEAENRWMADNPGKVFPGQIMCGGDKCTGHAVKISSAIGQIAACSRINRIVIDQTGLKGYYDFSFTFSPEKDALAMEVVGDDLGMKFEARSVPDQRHL